MVTEEEMRSRVFKPLKNEKISYRVKAGEMDSFRQKNDELARILNEYIIKYEIEHDCSRNKAYEDISYNCQQSADSFKKIFQKKSRITRELLYKFCLGMKLNEEESEKIFKLSPQGTLSTDHIGDFIFLDALRSGDDIFIFIDEYEKYVGKKISIRDWKK